MPYVNVHLARQAITGDPADKKAVIGEKMSAAVYFNQIETDQQRQRVA